MRPVGGHGIGGSNGTQGNGTFIGTLVAHHAHTLYGQKNDTRLPDLMVERCLVYVRESEELMDDARRAVSEAVDKCLSGRHTDWNKIKLVIRDSMNDYIWKKTKRKPMVIPIIMDVDV